MSRPAGQLGQGRLGVSESGAPLVFVNVLNWNGWEDTNQCLESLDRLDYENFRVLVVDNGSTDGSVERLRDHRVDLEILRLETNAGVARGNNTGLRQAMGAGAKYVWLLDNDTVVAPDALRLLVDAGEADSRRGAFVSRELNMETKEDWRSAFEIGDGRRISVRCQGCSGNGSWHRADMIRGASFMVRSKTLSEVGLFDEQYFHYLDEEDLAERIVVPAGTSALSAPRAFSTGADRLSPMRLPRPRTICSETDSCFVESSMVSIRSLLLPATHGCSVTPSVSEACWRETFVRLWRACWLSSTRAVIAGVRATSGPSSGSPSSISLWAE